MKKCNFQIAQQIVYRLLMYQQVRFLENNDFISKRIIKHCNNVRETRLENVCKIDDCLLVGRSKSHVLTNIELGFLNNNLDVTKIKECKKFCKMYYSSCHYTSCKYKRSKRKNDAVFQTKDDRFGIIYNIYKIDYDETSKVPIFLLSQRESFVTVKIFK